MDRIDIYVDGRTTPKNGSGFSVILISMNHKWQRSFTYGMNNVNLTDLIAVKFALLSINDKYRAVPVTIHTKNQYICNMFFKEDGAYSMTPKANIDLVLELRAMMEERDIKVEVTNDDFTRMCKEMTFSAINDGNLVDNRK